MTRDELVAKLLLLGFRKDPLFKYMLEYKNIMHMYINNSGEIIYSNYTHINNNFRMNVDDDYVIEKIIKFIENNPNDC